MKRPLVLVTCLLSAVANASQSSDLAALQGEVQVLKTQQQQILASLDELKKLLKPARN